MQFAATVHDGHLRKGTQVSYLSHLMSVSALVMENGGIVEKGTHDELLARKGRYYDLYTGQSALD